MSDAVVKRGADGRWLPGQSAHPEGKPPGPNKLAKLARAHLAENAEEFIALMKETARGRGSPHDQFAALKWICDRLVPQVKQIDITDDTGDDAGVITLKRGEDGKFKVEGDAVAAIFGEPPWVEDSDECIKSHR